MPLVFAKRQAGCRRSFHLLLHRTATPVLLTAAALVVHALHATTLRAQSSDQPNIIFLLADDMGYGDYGVFFQNQRQQAGDPSEPWHFTPQLDKLAGEGVQLRGHYCPAPVCAPSRASLLLGVHQGHSNIRDNQFDKELENNHTVASVLRDAGYATAAIGKYGLQGEPKPAPPDWRAHPLRRGFDDYYGYIRHRDGHAHYPKEDGKEVWDNHTEVSEELDGCYTTDLFTARAKKWIVDQRTADADQPFFLYLAFDLPHAKLQLPSTAYPEGGGLEGGVQWLGEPGRMINTAGGEPDSWHHPDYADARWDHDGDPNTDQQPWPDVQRRYATAVRRLDDTVGDLLQLLRDLEIDQNTLVVFSTDNGPSKESYLPEAYHPTFFDGFGPFDGIKRDVWEGGVRVGAVARWPARIPAGRVSEEPSMFHDWLATFAEMAGTPAPARSDGVSLLPTMTGEGEQKPSTVYVEYAQNGKTPEYDDFEPKKRGRRRGQMQLIRSGELLGVRYDIQSHSDPFEIYNVIADPKQTRNLASENERLQQQMQDAVLRIRRPNESAKRPYDQQLVPPLPVERTVVGVQWSGFSAALPWLAKLDGLEPSASGTADRPELDVQPPGDGASLYYTGYLDVPVNGEYTFSITADGSALLRIHDATVIDAAFKPLAGKEALGTIPLAAGKHPFRLYYQQATNGPPQLDLQWSSGTIDKQPVPKEIFRRDAE